MTCSIYQQYERQSCGSLKVLKKKKSSGSIACTGKIATSVLLKMFINGNKNATTAAPLVHEQNYKNSIMTYLKRWKTREN